MSESLYNYYCNVHSCMVDWRKYTQISQLKEIKDFIADIQHKKFSSMVYKNGTSDREVYTFFIASSDNDFAMKSADLKSLIATIKNPSDIILISKYFLGSRNINSLISYNQFRIVNYTHNMFLMIMPLAPMCYPHQILSKEEMISLLDQKLITKIENLPRILQNDVQCIWIDARIGQVIRIVRESQSGLYYEYRLVTSMSGFTSFRAEDNDDDDEDEDDKLINNYLEHADDENDNNDNTGVYEEYVEDNKEDDLEEYDDI